MPSLPWGLVTFDLDGTLTLGHGWRPIAAAFDRMEEFDATQRKFVARTIGEDEHLAELLDLARGRTVAEVLHVVAATPRLAGLGEGLAELRRAGVRSAVLSHNPDYVVDWYRATFGFDDAEGVAVPREPDGRIGRAGRIRADKPAGLARLAGRAGVGLGSVVHVGDGWADAALFPLVGGAVAVNSRLPEVERAADRAVHTRDFSDVVAAVLSLPPRP